MPDEGKGVGEVSVDVDAGEENVVEGFEEESVMNTAEAAFKEVVVWLAGVLELFFDQLV